MIDIRLPAVVSSNGKELWDWASRLSEATYLLDQGRKLRASIRSLETTCGSCDKWMKSSQCPKERNINGRNHGPSMADLKCQQFVMNRSSVEFLTTRRAELADVESRLRQDASDTTVA